MDWLKSIRAAAPAAPSSSSSNYELLHSSPELPTPSSTRPRPSHTRNRSSISYGYHRVRLRSNSALASLAFVPIVLLGLGFIIYHFVFRIYVVDEFVYGLPDVPEYDEYFAWEDRLPQHNSTLEFPEGPNGRYVMFSNQAWGYGLNNQLQEILLLSHISYLSQRSYVFQPYTWDAKTKANAVLDGRSWRSSRIPLNVFISGPTAGGAFAKGDPTPRAVNVGWWEKVCPPEKRTVLDVRKEHALWKVDSKTEGKYILENWAEKLKAMQDLCVEVTGPTILDFELIASPRILSTWPSLSASPIISRFAWSTLIQAAVHRNLPIFHDRPSQLAQDEPPLLPDETRTPLLHRKRNTNAPTAEIESSTTTTTPDRRSTYHGSNRRPPSPALSSLSLQSSNPHTDPSFTSNSTTSPTIKGLIAVHLRRGDFKMHCHWLADRIEPFAGWNQFPFLLDRFSPPESAPGYLGRGKNHELYMSRCWPEIDQIVRRLREIRRLHPGLERVFVLTNGKKDWVDRLKRALVQSGDGPVSDDGAEDGSSSTTGPPSLPNGEDTPSVDGPQVPPGAIRVQPVPPPATSKAGWKEVLTSKDLEIFWTEREIDQAVDMEIARRAEVFLGNGFSSLTSNIVMLRLSDSTPIENIRYW
ncbi:hypothetical protein M407DRAFT_107536 [Tulasnella calospora MUT 4182]|uniref:Uncharacterized protein n=1 Tax=Tulasnella calospora MUT 4182 TaxID=1051891 RepID=A0A0C3Q493_9AGAM|nr:hypothetical protein M407DRAFT_107536 [Tulasnella calospora MUT 4182]